MAFLFLPRLALAQDGVPSFQWETMRTMVFWWGAIPVLAGLFAVMAALALRMHQHKADDAPFSLLAYGWRPTLAASIVLMLFFGLTGYAVQVTQHKLMTDAWIRLQFEMDRIEGDVKQQFEALLPTLQGVRSAQAMGLRFRQDDMRHWVDTRDLHQEFPGVLGLGMVAAQVPVPGSTTVEVGRGGAVPFFEPDALAPVMANLDWNAHPSLYDALGRAARSGRAALSGPILLPGQQPARQVLVYALPIYATAPIPSTPSERLRTLQSFVFAPVNLADFLAGASIGAQGQLVFELYDGLEMSPDLRIYHSDSTAEYAGHHPMLEDRRNVLIGQRFFQLRVFTAPAFESATDIRFVGYIAFAGSALGVLFALVTWLLMAGRARALALAQGMTHELKRLAMVAERTSSAVVITDAQGRTQWVNEGFTRMAGYLLSEVQGRTPGSFMQSPRTSEAAKAAMRAAVAQGQPCRQRIVNLAKSGREYWLDIEIQPLFDALGRLEGFMAVEEDVSDQVAAQEALAREKERADGILLGSNVGTWQFNLLTGETLVNEQWSRMLGFEPHEVDPDVGAFFEAQVRPEDLVRINNLLAACRSGATKRYEADFRVRSKSGEWMWVLSRAAVLSHDAQGRPEWVAGIHMDVSEQRKTENGLRDMQAFLDRAGRAAGVGAWEIDLKTEAIHWSEQTCEIHGVDEGYRPSREEWLSYYPAPHSERLREAMALAPQTLSGWDLTLPFTNLEGDAKWLRIVGEVEFDDSGPVRMVGAVQDVTQIKNAETELMQTSAMLQSVLDSAVQVGVIATDLDRVITVFNKGAELMLGYSAEEMQHKRTASALFDLEQLTAIKELLALESGQESDATAVFNYVIEHPGLNEWTFVRKDQTRLTVSFLVSPLRDHAGKLVGYLGIAHDITAQKQQEDHLRQAMLSAEAASVAKSQFVANMSHEIRTPMNAILGMLRLLHNTPLSEQQKDYADKSEGAARSLLGLLNDILDFSKVEAGKLQLDPQPFVRDDLLADMAVILSSNLGAKPLDLVFDIDPALPAQMVGDALRIKQILINLGGNALKFTASGHVTLHWRVLSHAGNRVRTYLAVEDTGIGIAVENQDRIFEGFSQAEASTTRKYGGTGLGLAISQRLVRLMGAELVMHSVLGQGTTLSFELDLLVPPALAQQAAPAPVEPRRILVVDDLDGSRSAIAQAVVALGWHATEAASGEMALQCLGAPDAPPFDAVLLDERMPGLDGWDTFKAIRACLPAAQRPRVLLLRSQGRELLAQQHQAEWALLDGVLAKPLTSGLLAQGIARAFQNGQGEATPASQAAPAHRAARLAGMRILVVEDNAINQQVARELLGAEGAVVQLADNGQLGVDALRKTPTAFDVVLMDLQMPVLDGLSAARLIRQELGLRDLPVIAMTANAMASDREACLAAGMNDHVGKPFDLGHLTQTLRKHVAGDWDGTPLPQAAAPGPVAAVVSTAADWPAGVEVQAAIGRMGGFADLYGSTLQAYLQECADFPRQFPAALATADLEGARRLVHSFKGLSATVGVGDLQSQAAALEQLLKSGASAEQAGAAFVGLEQAIARWIPTLQSLCRQLAPATEGGAEPPDAAQQDLLERLLDLQQLLQNQDMGALELHATLRQNSTLADDIIPWESLDTAMANLEFEIAEAECAELIEHCKGARKQHGQ